MGGRIAIAFLLFFSVAFLLFPQTNERRSALVVGNSLYAGALLKYASNDARDLSQALKELGFTVTTLIDAGREKIFNAIRDLGKELANGGTGLFYFAGYGVQVKGANYLVPVGADVQSEDEVPFQAIDASLVLSKMGSAGNKVNIVILDACRDNPFAKSFKNASRGLAAIEALKGSLIVYAAAPGSVAADGTGQNSIFTGALLKHIRTPGVDAELMLRQVRQEVMNATANAQEPWISSSLPGSFSFVPAPEVEKSFGSVVVEVKAKGTLYLNGTSMGELSPGPSASLKDVEAGHASLEMRYSDGKTETRTVEVPKNATVTVSFSHVEQPGVSGNMILIQGGSFRMGDESGEGSGDEKPVHSVIVSSFYLGKYEVTQKEWKEVMGTNPSHFTGDDLPVDTVNWYDAVQYCNKLSEKNGLDPVYKISGANITADFTKNGFRLPTEAEWEFAARGGTRSSGYKYAGSSNVDQVGWYAGNSASKTHPVGQKQSNELGLFDMTGNVWEWCWDLYGPYASASQSDPTGASSGGFRVMRGGSWDYGERIARATARNGIGPGGRGSASGGFRVATRVP